MSKESGQYYVAGYTEAYIDALVDLSDAAGLDFQMRSDVVEIRNPKNNELVYKFTVKRL